MKLPDKEVFKLGSEVHSYIEGYHKGAVIQDEKVAKFLEKYGKIYGRKSDFIEEFFQIPLIDPFTKKPLHGGILISGKMDRIDDGYIYDHKTSSTSWSQNKLDKDMQATFYSYLYRMRFQKEEKGIIFNIIRKTGQTIDTYGIKPMKTRRTLNDFISMMIYIRENIEKIKQADGSYHKSWCPNAKLLP